MFGVSDILKSVDCKTVRILRIQVKQKVWNEAKNRERDWGQTLKIRFFFSRLSRVRLARFARVLLISHGTDFFTHFEKNKPDCFAVCKKCDARAEELLFCSFTFSQFTTLEARRVPQLFLGSSLGTRRSAIGQLFPLSLMVSIR